MYFPAEMMCGKHLENKNNSNDDENKNNEKKNKINTKSIDVLGVETNDDSKKDKIEEENLSHSNEFNRRLEILGHVIENKNSKLINKEKRGLTENEINCDDLDGWDFEGF